MRIEDILTKTVWSIAPDASAEVACQNRGVAELLTPHVVVAAPETTIKQAANLLRGRIIGW